MTICTPKSSTCWGNHNICFGRCDWPMNWIQFAKWKMRWISDRSEVDLFQLNWHWPQHAGFLCEVVSSFRHCISTHIGMIDAMSEFGNGKIDYQMHRNYTNTHSNVHIVQHMRKTFIECVVTFLCDWMQLLAKIQKSSDTQT